MTRSPLKFAVALLAAIATLLTASAAQASQNLYLANGDIAGVGQALVFPLGADGAVASAPSQTLNTGEYLNGISMSPDGKYAFMADYTANTFTAFSVGADGKLTETPQSPIDLGAGSAPYGSAATADGKYVIVSDYDRHGIEVLKLGADGSLSQIPGGFVEADPNAYPYGIAVSTDSRYVFVPDITSDQVYVYALDANGVPTEIAGSPFMAGDTPYEAAVTPDGKYLYVPNYASNDVSGYSIGADGSLTPLPGSPYAVATQSYGGWAITPDGKHLYLSGSNEAIDSIAIGADGALTTSAPSTQVGDYNPGLAVSPDGKYLYNSTSNPSYTVGSYAVGASGALTAFGTPVAFTDGSPDIQSAVVSPNQGPKVVVRSKPAAMKNEVTFNASDSTDPDGTVASYAWDFGDGTTATTEIPITSHDYVTAGDYKATLTITDNQGCSTTVIYTGQTALCNGSGAAKAEVTADAGIADAKVKAKKTQKQKGSLKIAVKAGAGEQVKVIASGNASFKGVKDRIALKKAKGSVEAGKTKTLKLKAKKKDQGKAVVGFKGKARLSVKLTDDAGNVVTEKLSVKLK